ncbi:enoyl-CoA hydratase/isomerase family protein [Nocardia aobensis]|uniref:Enoyl-CoA hydratase/isomerase family protein n=1 Tax=Nocardia aobensis TaxID=257277 RepID=A0ABW6P9L0_9NOCA
MGAEQTLYGVRVRDENAVRIVTLDRPERRNALDLTIRPVLAEVFEKADADPAVRAIVLTGRDGAFCSGGDVSLMERMTPDVAVPRLEAAQRIVRSIAGGSTPVVAAVDGVALAAGLGLALACDRIVASSTARFSARFTGVGLAADLGISWSLPRRIGVARARHLMMLGGLIHAEEALRLGMVDAVVEPADVLATAMAEAQLFASGPPRALALIKGLFADPPPDLHAALDRETAIQAELMDTDDFAEGIAAFAQKRPARFPGT